MRQEFKEDLRDRPSLLLEQVFLIKRRTNSCLNTYDDWAWMSLGLTML